MSDITKRTCRTCRWSDVCIDPCDGCPNMDAAKFDDKGEVILETCCPYDQGDRHCMNVVAPTCTQYERKLKGKIDQRVEAIKKSLS